MRKFSRSSRTILFLLIVLSLLAAAGCNRSTTATVEPPAPDAEKPVVEDEEVSEPEDAEDAEQADEAMPPPQAALPVRIQFKAEDGKELVGNYFPGAEYHAPTVILMHWAGGDQRDWLAIATWLQNRQDELTDFEGWEMAIGIPCSAQRTGPWLDPTWFPPMPEDVSFNVFIFDFRDFCESESGINSRAEWALDAKAAFAEVSLIETTDPNRIVAIGASIGADGAPDGCLLHNQESDTCLGGFSLSPGSYLEMPYADVVRDLDGDAVPPAVPVWCLAATGDTESYPTCQSATGDHYKQFIYDGDEHGMMLIKPELEPNPMVLIQDFLEETFGLVIN